MAIVFAAAAARWSSYYSNHQLVSVTIRFLHLAGLVLAGGTALYSDRQILRARRAGISVQQAVLSSLDAVHAETILGLAVLGITGLLMATADTATFLVSKLFWTKMFFVALLLGNGVFVLLAERRARRRGAAGGWPRLVVVSAISAFLWLATLFLGTLLTVAA